MKHLSILMISRGISLIWLSDEYPVPKSSSATLTPSAFISLSIPLHAHHVIDWPDSLSPQDTDFPVLAHLVNYAFDFLGLCHSAAAAPQTVYVDLVVRMSHVIPVPQCFAASLNTCSPIGFISPRYSASGIKSTGFIKPMVAEFHLTRASAPAQTSSPFTFIIG